MGKFDLELMSAEATGAGVVRQRVDRSVTFSGEAIRPRILIAAQQIRPSQPRLPDRLDAVHPRHGIVDDQKINFSPAFQYANCCLGAARLVHGVADGSEELAQKRPYVVVVVTEQRAGSASTDFQ